MSRAPLVPEELTRGPFTVSEALRAGLTRRQLQGKSWTRISTGLYVWARLAEDPRNVLRALRTVLPQEAAFSDRTAAWLHGLDIGPCRPVEVTAPDGCGVSDRAAVSLRRSALPRNEIVECQGLPTTSPIRTAFDMARHLPLGEAVVAVDMALHSALVELDDLHRYVAARSSAKGAGQARRVAELAEPRAESPMESRLRVLLVLAGLPRPAVQTELMDERGRFLGRPDLYYASHRLGIEYDGGTHRESLVADNRRQNRLLASGYRLLRFTAADVYNRPDSVVAQVRSALRS
jgi:hypothetical protein